MSDTMRIVTTDKGYFKPGLRGSITDGAERTVWLGPVGNESRHTIPEFTVRLDCGMVKEFCQYGRDFVFEKKQ